MRRSLFQLLPLEPLLPLLLLLGCRGAEPVPADEPAAESTASSAPAPEPAARSDDPDPEVRADPDEPDPYEEGAQLVDALLAALGGRERWARLGAVEIEGTTRVAALDEAVPLHTWRELDAYRARLEQTRGGQVLAYVLDGDRAWQESDGTSAPLDSAQRLRLFDAEYRGLYRVLRRLARGDDVAARAVLGGRIELYDTRREGAYLGWLRAGPDGRPDRFGTPDSPGGGERTVVIEAWGEVAGYAFPVRYASEDGSVAVVNTRFVPDPEIDPELFRAPGE